MRQYWGWGSSRPILTTVVLMISLSMTALAESLGNLNQSQLELLKNLNLPVAIPRYIPPGFTVDTITLPPVYATGRLSYQILYRNSENHCFYISGFMGGIGGPEAGFVFPTETPLFGKTTINIGAVFDSPYNQTPSSQQLNSPQSEIWSFSVKDSIYYGIGTEEKREGCTKNQTLTPLEIEKILQSMSFL